MSDIDDLCQAIRRGTWLNFEELAEEIIASGFHRDRIVTTAEELDALPEGSIVCDADYIHLTKDYGGWYMTRVDDPDDVRLPATVLWEPEAGDE